jgi:hypothetical protein
MRGVLLVVLLALTVPAVARAEVPDSPDVFNLSTLNALDVQGNEVAFTTPQQLAPSYNSSAYEYDPSFSSSERARMGCANGPSFSFGSHTAWERFVVGAAGTLKFSASSSYDVMLFAFRTNLPRGTKGFGQDVLVSLDCQDERHGTGDELPLAPFRVAPGQVILLATASYCATNPAVCPGAENGGATTLSVTYTPDDADGDGTADTLDACPTVPAPGGCPASGGVPNPDADGDGVFGDRDKCPTVKGTEDDGCLDSDHDAVSDFADRCPQTAGNGRDGCPQPLKATFPNEWVNFASFSRVQKLQVKAPKGSTVRWRCSGRGCRRKRATMHPKHPAESLKRYLKRTLPRGTTIEVRVSAPLTLGTYVRFQVRGGRANPRRTDRCIAATGRLTRC